MGLGTLRQEALHYVSLIFIRDDPLWSWLRREITQIIDHQQLKDFAESFKELARMLGGQKVLPGKFKEWTAPEEKA
jgi:hypothetical protein